MALTPVASRPQSQGYGILPADEGQGLLPFSWATERLAATRCYWLSTLNPDGSPHTAPLWGVWIDGVGVGLSTGRQSQKWRNLETDRRCTVSTESGSEAVFLQGVMEPLDEAGLAAFVANYQHKYGMDPSSMGEPMFAVRPTVVFAMIDEEDKFAGSATRWTFA